MTLLKSDEGAGTTQSIVGYVCRDVPPPPKHVAQPLKPDGPKPPTTFSPVYVKKPPAPPPDETGWDIRVFTTKEADGTCWRVVEWRHGGGLSPKKEKTRIDCSEL